MGKGHTVRFASGHPEKPFSGVWRLVIDKDEVFLGSSKFAMGIFKISLHQSGVWVLAFTEQSGATSKSGNRRTKQWKRPLDVHGVTRGPSIFVPHTSLGIRPLLPNEYKKKVLWFPGPPAGHMVEFHLYFVASGAVPRWDTNLTVLGQSSLTHGKSVVLLASSQLMPADFAATVEHQLRENVFGMTDLSGFKGGSFLWFTESRDAIRTPIIVDMPVAIGATNSPIVSQ